MCTHQEIVEESLSELVKPPFEASSIKKWKKTSIYSDIVQITIERLHLETTPGRTLYTSLIIKNIYSLHASRRVRTITYNVGANS